MGAKIEQAIKGKVGIGTHVRDRFAAPVDKHDMGENSGELASMVRERQALNYEIVALTKERGIRDHDIVVEMMEQGLAHCLTINWTRLCHVLR